MSGLYAIPDDFEAVIRILTYAQGGRSTPAFNGIRWDFAYAEDPPAKELFMIYPDFLEESGASYPKDKPLPTDIELKVRMVVVRDEMRQEVHRSRLREGVVFFCHEGSRSVAEGRVTRITGLHAERTPFTGLYAE